MLTMAVVEKCPYTKAGTGVMRLSHSVIATLAGAVHDKIEWMALLVGTRSDNGLDVAVTGLRVPLQERGTVDCKLVKHEPLTPDIVGVVHSHHSMSAFFSQTDDEELNPRFPTSIVVAQNKHNASEVEELYGFSYKAEGRAPLPCGTMGIINYVAIPEPFIDAWPIKPVVGFATPDLATTFNYCPHATRTREGLMHHCEAKCGATSTEKGKAIFGVDGDKFLKEVQEKTRGSIYGGNQGYQGYVVNDNRYFGKKGKNKMYKGSWNDDDAYEQRLRHWGMVD